MGETVLCGSIRVEEVNSSTKKRFQSHVDCLESFVPFVYFSMPNDRRPVPENRPIIEDRNDNCHHELKGQHSVLKVLRQPVLFVSISNPAPDSLLMQKLIERWNESRERISGVFPRTDRGIRLFPGLYASPLLPTLRNLNRGSTVSVDSVIQSEPIRTVEVNLN